jgi:predicted transcriptional regulator
MSAMSLRLPDDLTERLREAAKEEGRSMNGAAVIAIEHWLDRREAGHVQSLFEDIATRHARLLDRLGDA